jgi:hypothetical protein
MLVLCLNTAPLLLMGLAWWFYRNESASLANWRRGVFVSAFVANAVSIAVLVSFFVHAYLVSRGSKPVDLDRMYPVFSMMGLALLTRHPGTGAVEEPLFGGCCVREPQWESGS